MTMNLILAIGIMIIAGFFGGVILARIKFPMITGYLIVGILLSPSVLHLIPKSTIEDLAIITSIALGIIAYLIGGSLHVESMRKLGKSIAWIALLQSVIPWILTTLVIIVIAPFILDIPGATFSSVYFPMAFVLGAVATATAPAVTIAITREYEATGPLTTTSVAVVVLSDAIAIFAFAIATGIAGGLAQPLDGGGVGFSAHQALFVPFLHIIESVAIGVVFGLAVIFVARLVKTRILLLSIVFGTIMLGVGIAELWNVSSLLINMVFGFVVVSKAEVDDLLAVIQDIENLIFIVFFVLAGMHFDIAAIGTAGVLTIAIILPRIAGKYFGARIGSRIAGGSDVVRKYLGLTLLPKAGITVGLAFIIESTFPTFGIFMFDALIASTVINTILTPPLAKYAIFKAGEANT